MELLYDLFLFFKKRKIECVFVSLAVLVVIACVFMIAGIASGVIPSTDESYQILNEMCLVAFAAIILALAVVVCLAKKRRSI